jgi:predicted ATPase
MVHGLIISLDQRLLERTFSTPALTGNTGVRILLPSGYAVHPNQRYPVLYLPVGRAEVPQELLVEMRFQNVAASRASWRQRAKLDACDEYGARVARSRDERRFGAGPYVLGLHREQANWGTGFPFDVPAVAAVEDLRLERPVTILAGENGSGKSTVLEAVAEAVGFGAEGGELDRLGELPAVPRSVLGGALVPVLSATKPRNGYYLRAESFFNIAAFIDSTSLYAPDLSIYGDVPLHQQSHGESFLALAANRFGRDGLYLLDEPEAALSVSGALALLAVITRAASDGAQFVIATHSPILLACPHARVYELDQDGVDTPDYDDLQAVRLTRGFLAAPERFLRALDAEAGDDRETAD